MARRLRLDRTSSTGRIRPRTTVLIVAALAGAALAALAGMALAKTKPTLSTAHNAKVPRQDESSSTAAAVTVYTLSGETTHHLTVHEGRRVCFQFWPPETVKSAKAKLQSAGGHQGQARDLAASQRVPPARRSAGHPLYTFSPDGAARAARPSGEGIDSFGGDLARRQGVGGARRQTALRRRQPPRRPRPRTRTGTRPGSQAGLGQTQARARRPLYFVKRWPSSACRTGPAGVDTATSSSRSATRRWSSSSA